MMHNNTIPGTSAVFEGEHRTTKHTADTPPPDPEVVTRQKRRRHTIAYKIKIVEAVASLRSEGYGSISEFLRSEGIYYSMVNRWARQYAEGTLVAAHRGATQKSRLSLVDENKRLRRKLEQLEQRLARTEMIVELQKKLSSILDMAPTQAEHDPMDHEKSDDQ
jgi:transposase-like protein